MVDTQARIILRHLCQTCKRVLFFLSLNSFYLIDTPLTIFPNRADPDQADLELPDQGLFCLLMEM